MEQGFFFEARFCCALHSPGGPQKCAASMHAPKLTASMQQIGHFFAVHFEGSAQPRGEAVVTAYCGLSERWPSPPDGIGQRQSDLNFFKVVPTEAAGKRSLAEAGPSQRENAKSCLLLKCHKRRIGRAFSWFCTGVGESNFVTAITASRRTRS